MNIAEIRKKANRDRAEAVNKPETTFRSDTECVESINDAHEMQVDPPFESVVEDEPDCLIEEDNSVDTPPEGFTLEYELIPEPQTVESPAPHVISTPVIPASVAMEYAAETAPPPNGATDNGSELPSGSGKELDSDNLHRFDPLEILLAGRASSGYGENLDFSVVDDVENEALDYHEFLCFRVCREQYAINIMEIKEIIKPREITEVPRSPDFIKGVLSLRGIIIPVFNMMRRLHLESVENSLRERIIVVSRGEELFGIQVDEVLQVVRIPEGSIEAPPAVLEGIDRDFVLGIGRYSSGMLILLNMGSILDVSLC